jgi:hypothetical protein
MSISLGQILDFSENCYKKPIKNNEFENVLIEIKNTLNNEKFETFTYGFLNLNELISFPTNENILYVPFESDDENKKILNAILSITYSYYFTLNKHEKENIINSIQVNYEEYAENNSFNLLILNVNTQKIKWNDNKSQCTIVLIKYNEYIMSLYNVTTKYYMKKSECVMYLLNNYKEEEIINECVEILTETMESQYEEVKQNSKVKTKKSKINNDIFIKQQNFEEKNEINIEQLKILINSAKITNTLGELQEICYKLNIDITKGLTKTNKPKQKTKVELLNEIKMYNI